MLFKTVTARSMEDAMDQIRRAFGDDAVIVSSATDKKSGQVSVTAAVDKTAPGRSEDESQFQLKPQKEPEAKARPLELEEFVRPLDAVGEAFDNHSVPRPIGDPLLQLIESLELDDPAEALAKCLEKKYTFAPLKESELARPLMLVGPPGAGKTLLTAKIATRCKLQGLEVTTITTDTIKAGGFEQLKNYTDVIKIDLMAARTPEDLTHQVGRVPEGHVIIIDTTGVNPYDPADIDYNTELITAAQAEPLLVVSAGGDAQEATRLAGRFEPLFESVETRRFAYTRLDMTRHYGSILTFADRGGFAFSDVSVSPMVAEGFNHLTPKRLSQLLLKGTAADSLTSS